LSRRFCVLACALTMAGLAVAVAVAAAGPALAVTAAPRGLAKDYSIVAGDIVPSGQYGSVPAPVQATRQAQMYNALTPLFNHVTSADLLSGSTAGSPTIRSTTCNSSSGPRI
jgi:hypothetical protein